MFRHVPWNPLYMPPSAVLGRSAAKSMEKVLPSLHCPTLSNSSSKSSVGATDFRNQICSASASLSRYSGKLCLMKRFRCAGKLIFSFRSEERRVGKECRSTVQRHEEQ